MIVRPFAALRSTSENAQMLSCVPYDVIDTAEARQLAHGNPLSWLHVIRAEIDLPAGTDEHAPAVYTKAAENLTSFRKREWIVDESGPALYVYRMTMGDHVQTGILACCSVGEYDNGIIKKHELTRKDKEDDRTRYIVTTQMQTEPVLLTYRDQPGLEPLMEAVIRRPATLKSTSETGVVHEIWRIEAPQPFVDFFTRIPVAYIADGHHRSASASRARTECRGRNPNHTGREEYNFFLAAIYPASQMKILAYNRLAVDLNRLIPDQVLQRASEKFEIGKTQSPIPNGPRQFCLYLNGAWQLLRIKSQFIPQDDPVGSLDCSLLQQHFLDPILGIKDLRTDKRIGFVGGIRGTQALEQKVDRGEAAIAFSMYPTSVEQLMAIADAGQIMPPKSTWFEPKLRSGLVMHVF